MTKPHLLTSALVLLLVAGSLAFAGCDTGNGPVAPDIPVETENADGETRYIYHIAYKDVTFASDEVRASWREPLLALISNEAELKMEKSAGDSDYIIPDPTRPYIHRGWRLALLDINVDGTPELIVDMGGGSSGNAFYEVYDIRTGALLGTVDGDQSDAFCTYLDTETGNFEVFGCFDWQMGWAGRSRYVRKLRLATDAEGKSTVEDLEYLSAGYSLEGHLTETAPEGAETWVSEWQEECVGARFFVNGERVTFDEYHTEYDAFIRGCMRIPETNVAHIRRYDYETAEELVDALLGTDQQFILPNP